MVITATNKLASIIMGDTNKFCIGLLIWTIPAKARQRKTNTSMIIDRSAE